MKNIISIIALSFCISSLAAQSVKGLYVDGFNSILGNTQREDSLLNYAQLNGFNYLALYELHLVHAQYDMTDFSSITPLADFISRAKTQFGILKVGATAENFWFFQNRVRPYNAAHTNINEKFDVYNLEFEFWINSTTGPSGYYCTTYLQPASLPCDTSGAFAFYKNELRQIDSVATLDGTISETYVGWPNQGQCQQIAALCDRVLVHAYVGTDATAYGYTQTRLSYFAGTSQSPNPIIVIFSSEQSFMGPWLNTNPETQAFSTYNSDFQNDASPWTAGIDLLGYQWFAYTDMPYSLPLAVNEQENTAFHLFPHDEFLEITFSNNIQEITSATIYNSAGQLVYRVADTEIKNHCSISTGNYTSGIYFLTVQYCGSAPVTKKFAIIR
ncbi:MAG: T9SS type A sorting domain-containing protein [Bacteroidota bacterium]|nr:T9SS type A sorting domain-containing protein [Bacteroidota bacterium]